MEIVELLARMKLGPSASADLTPDEKQEFEEEQESSGISFANLPIVVRVFVR